MRNQQRQKKPVDFKQTYITRTCYVRRRDFDNKWQVVELKLDPSLDYDNWEGPLTVQGDILKPWRWITTSVHDTRAQAIEKAKEGWNE